MAGSDHMDNENELTHRLIEMVGGLSLQRKQMLEELLGEWQRMDYREDSRISCFLPVDYSTTSRVYQDFIHNLSNGGVFIETAASLRQGQPISLTFSVPSLQKSFKARGAVVRTDKDGIGVRFVKKLSAYQKEIIHSAVSPK